MKYRLETQCHQMVGSSDQNANRNVTANTVHMRFQIN